MAIFDFALINNENTVENIVTVEKENIEEGLSLLNTFFYKEGRIWRHFDKNNIKHKNCSVSCKYVEELDCYRLDKYKTPNLASWIFSTTTYEWEPPIKKPIDPEDQSGKYGWRETEYQSTGNGWVFFPSTTS